MENSEPVFYYQGSLEDEYVADCLAEIRNLGLDPLILDAQGDLGAQFRGRQAMIDIGGHSSREIIDAGQEVRLWQILGTGLDHADVGYMLSKGIRVAHTPGFTSARGLSETAMMFILMLTRKFAEAEANFFDSVFYEPCGRTLNELTLGIIGFGASGRQLARRAKPFGMRIEAIDILPLEGDIADDIRPDFFGTPDDMDDVVARADFVSLHLHLTPETTHIMNAQRLGLMKPTAGLINVARGALVDEDALAAALLDGSLGGAGIDVFANEPADVSRPEYQLPNMIVMPHTSGQTDDTIRNRCAIVADNVRRVATGEDILNEVDASMGLGKF